MERAETRYARSGDLSIAYQVIGDADQAMIFCPGFVSNVELCWAEPIFHQIITRSARYARVVMFDKRGTGLSDPVSRVPTLEERTDDIRAVLDDAGIERAAVHGVSEGGPMAMLFAAQYPERVTHLSLYGTYAVGPLCPGAGEDPRILAWKERVMPILDDAIVHWGEGRSIDFLAPKAAHRPLERRMWATWERSGASPGVVRKLVDSGLSSDVRPFLSAISAPTLVVHFQDDIAVPRWCGEDVAASIEGARLVILPGGDHVPFSLADVDRAADEVEGHITGVRPAATPDRQLLTVVFTDIVGSTERAASLGDAEWGALVEHHDRVVRSLLREQRGREIKTLGDGFLATFDGPGRAVEFARLLGPELEALDLGVRIGVHTGDCDVTLDDVRGMAVNIAARVCGLAGSGEVLVTSTVRDLVAGSGVGLHDRGRHALKGVPGEWQLAAVGRVGAEATADPAALLPTSTPTTKRSDRVIERVAGRYPGITRAGIRLARSLAR